jgi:hypothetical protein
MSLLDQLPHVALLFPATKALDSYGNVADVIATEPIEVRARISMTRNSHDPTLSDSSDTTYKMITRDIRIPLRSKVEWNGLIMIVESVIDRDDSFETRHTTSTLRVL